uniref:TRC8_N domain-containing protein n=1 Tax=Macrostomum lignano TaxID=282301 RepID=A0A1I8JQ24_9PLAT
LWLLAPMTPLVGEPWQWHNAAAALDPSPGRPCWPFACCPGAVADLRVLFDRLGRMIWADGWVAVPTLHLWQPYATPGLHMTDSCYSSGYPTSVFASFSTGWRHLPSATGLDIVLLGALSDSCSSPLCILGLCVTVSHASWFVLLCTKLFPHGGGGGWRGGFANQAAAAGRWRRCRRPSARLGGGLHLPVGAVQTNLPHTMRTPQWASLVTVVAFILVSSLLDSVHEIAGPRLLPPRAAVQSAPYGGHARALAVIAVLLCAPVYLTVWLLRLRQAVLVLYCLFLYDHFRSGPTEESFEDLVFYVKSSVRLSGAASGPGHCLLRCQGILHSRLELPEPGHPACALLVQRCAASAERLAEVPAETPGGQAAELAAAMLHLRSCVNITMSAPSASATCSAGLSGLSASIIFIRCACEGAAEFVACIRARNLPMCQQAISIPNEDQQQNNSDQFDPDEATQAAAATVQRPQQQQPQLSPSAAASPRRSNSSASGVDLEDFEDEAAVEVSSSTDSEVYRQDDGVDLAVYRPAVHPRGRSSGGQ